MNLSKKLFFFSYYLSVLCFVFFFKLFNVFDQSERAFAGRLRLVQKVLSHNLPKAAVEQRAEKDETLWLGVFDMR